jgi:hypothetical protein
MAEQAFTITSTYDPSTNTLTCNTTSVMVKKGNIGKVTLNLELKAGSPGSIAFQSDPLEWSTPPTTTTPPKSFTVVRRSDTETFITAPNSGPPPVEERYSFLINYIYTKPDATSVSGTSDPTIILEGTGSGAC